MTKNSSKPMLLYPLMEAVRSGGDLGNLGGDGKYSKTVVCPDSCVMFRITAKPLGNENFHKGILAGFVTVLCVSFEMWFSISGGFCGADMKVWGID